MSRNWMIGVVMTMLVAVLPLQAHEGHAHKVMGTIESIAGNHLVVTTTDGKTATVMIDRKTKITRGKAALQAAALKVGDRIVAEGSESKAMMTAATVRVGEAAAK
jgi:hypothetical protein